jgi:hypothetical protein
MGLLSNFSLYPNWKDILRKAWSIKFMIIAGLLSAGEVVIPLFGDVIPRNLFASLSGFFCCAAFVARLVAQKGV